MFFESTPCNQYFCPSWRKGVCGCKQQQWKRTKRRLQLLSQQKASGLMNNCEGKSLSSRNRTVVIENEQRMLGLCRKQQCRFQTSNFICPCGTFHTFHRIWKCITRKKNVKQNVNREKEKKRKLDPPTPTNTETNKNLKTQVQVQ